jgi:two-component system response regulator FixJ
MNPRLSPDKPTVAVVDRNPTAAAQLLRAATDLGFPSADWSDVEDYFAQAPSDPRGCLLIDYPTVDMPPEELLARLEARRMYLPVVFLWPRCDVSLVVRAMKAGALDGLKKPCPPPMLAQTIRGAMAFDAQHHQARLDAARCRRRLARLGPDERRLLAMLTGGLANKDIAFELNVCLRTAEDRRAKLMAKMKAENLAEMIRQAICGSRCESLRTEFVGELAERIRS